MTEIEKDAERYRWLKKQGRLTLIMERTRCVDWWGGVEYISTHYLAIDNVCCKEGKSLDATIDEVMSKISKENFNND